MDYDDILKRLEGASGFELYRLREALGKMMEDPARMNEVRMHLRVGQEVEYLEQDSGRSVAATVLEVRRTRVLVANRNDGARWTLPFYWINLGQEDLTPANTGGVGLKRHEVSVGMALGFKDRNGQERYGKAVRLNPKTVTIDCGAGSWRVAYAFLFAVQDIVEEGDSGELLQLGD